MHLATNADCITLTKIVDMHECIIVAVASIPKEHLSADADELFTIKLVRMKVGAIVLIGSKFSNFIILKKTKKLMHLVLNKVF